MAPLILLACITTIPNFAFRTFSTVLLIALMARFEFVSLGAAWLTLDLTMFILLLLSILEHFAKDWLKLIEKPIKSAAGFLVSQSLVSGNSAIILKYIEISLSNFYHVEASAGVATFATTMPYISSTLSTFGQLGASAGITTFATTMPYISSTLSIFGQLGASAGIATFATTFFSFIWAGIAALGVWWMTSIRRQVLDAIRELDEDDDLGLQKVINWSEEGWVIGGVVITFVFPIAAMGMFLMTLLGIFLAKKYAERLEQKSQVPCPTCSQPIHASAITCSECRQPNPNPFQVGWLGQPKVNQLVTDLNAHRLQLVGRKRCPECATQLKEKRIHQPCPTCFTETFANAQQVEVYLANLNQQLPRIMMISFILGFIPLLGIIPGIIYYRFTLIASLRGYVPRATGCLTRWGVRMMNLFLIGFQPVPPIGFFVLPLMCLINFRIYESIIRRESNKTFGGGGGYSRRETPVAQP